MSVQCGTYVCPIGMSHIDELQCGTYVRLSHRFLFFYKKNQLGREWGYLRHLYADLRSNMLTLYRFFSKVHPDDDG